MNLHKRGDAFDVWEVYKNFWLEWDGFVGKGAHWGMRGDAFASPMLILGMQISFCIPNIFRNISNFVRI